ncbi:MAG: cyclopropane-fatty-acyl-phospholipid synthase family protein [Geminicoccaceae bacterium]
MLMDQVLKRFVKIGDLTVTDSAGKVHRFTGALGRTVKVRFTSRAAERQLLFDPELALAEGYMDGTLVFEQGDLYDLLDLGTHNLALSQLKWSVPVERAIGWLKRRALLWNTATKSRRNVERHYDLSGALYGLFLDSERQYTCAYHPTGKEDIETAQRAKERHIAAKLLVRPGQRIVDLGCGFGALSLHLGRHYDVDVTGVTLSREQYEWANARAAELGIADRVRFLHLDYRSVEGVYDRVVSIGMLEHVGPNHLPTCFEKIKSLMAPDGLGLVHSIGRQAGPAPTSAFIDKYIFPGGYIPAVSETIAAIEPTGMWITDVEILRLHYAETLKEWRAKFMAGRDQMKALYDERFCRMWEFYLVSAECFFRRMDGMNFQIQLAKDRHAVPLIRDYMIDDERAAARRQMPVAAAA